MTVHDEGHHAPAAAPSQRLLTFRSAGWVILLALLICAALATWAIAPAVLRMRQRPPGDGQTLESYGFDLDPLLIDRELVAAELLHRDMIDPIDQPVVLEGAAIEQLNAERGKYLLGDDRVVGVTIAGESRAYPISVLNVHAIVHDTLGETPIAVIYHWPSGAITVLDRRAGDDVIDFGVSGLLYNADLLMYRRGEGVGGEPLWSQMLGAAVSGDDAAAGLEMDMIPYELTSWRRWLAAHPQTTVIDRRPGMIAKRYTKADPGQYFRAGKVVYPATPLPPAEGPAPLTPAIAVQAGGAQRAYPIPYIAGRAGAGRWTTELGGVQVSFSYDAASQTVEVRGPDGAPLPVRHALWFVWHAFREHHGELRFAEEAMGNRQ